MCRRSEIVHGPAILFGMETAPILSMIDAEIFRLKQARALLAGITTDGRGVQPSSSATTKPHQKMSTDARKRIAEAQRKRWAAVKRNAK